MLLVCIVCGCTALQNNNSDSINSEQQATKQASDFFNEHPEYVNSKDQESRLFAEFQQVMEQPENKNLSMYQMLIIAHDQLQRK